MLKNYLKTYLRSFKRNKVFALINVLGLSVGIACTMLILIWVRYELNYDHFHENLDRICRVVIEHDGFRTPTTPGPMAAFLKSEIPEIADATRFKGDKTIISYGDKSLRLKGVNAEPAFMDIFSFPQIKGDAKSGLDDASSIVLTAEAAKKIFGDEEPVGKVVKLSNKWTAKVAAVIGDVPDNSSPPLQFEYLYPFKVYHYWREPDSWEASSDYNTWVLLNENVSLAEVNQKVDALIKKHNPDPNLRIFLQPMEEIHLRADCHRWDGPHGDMQNVIIFSLLAVIILAIACMNFMNLATARSTVRAREVGIRKVTGAGRGQLIRQYLMESFLFSLIALPLSAILIELTLPEFSRLAGHSLSFNYLDPWVLLSFVGIFAITGLVSGLYPAVFLSSFKPASILKNGNVSQMRSTKKWSRFSAREGMVVLQFALSITVIICTFVIYNQLTFIQNEQLGFDEDNLVYIYLENRFGEQAYPVAKNELLSLPEVLSVGGSDQIPTDTDFIPVTNWKINGELKGAGFPAFMVDEDFLETYKMELQQGISFSGARTHEEHGGFVINEAAVEALGYEQPLGQEIEVYRKKGPIIGIVKNFHFETFREEIEPLFMMKSEKCCFFNIRIIPGDPRLAIDKIKSVINTHYPGMPFEYQFLDAEIDKLYRTEKRMGQMFTYFAVLAIFLSCLGLYGLISFVAERKTKEIGIRKVLGASVSGIVKMLSMEFTKWTVIANLIAWPAAWFGMNGWLQNFAYRIEIGPLVFIVAGLLVFIITLITVSSQAIRAATANPVEALRYE